MTLFRRFKELIAYRKRQAAERELVAPCGAAEDNEPPSFGGRSGIAGTEKLKRVKRLTPREHELYLLLLEGFTLKESAKQLLIKYSTANTHMTGIYKKLGIKSRAELIINYRDINGGDTQAHDRYR